ncbi:MAG: cation-translocating P-type ATPase [Castellaniella sp.]|uniref:heavy metal translocating P-type ATPase n=1 Tax=Castellaniella sp. TaxID=1955812 RepID=UPI002A36F873|nr:cation-translocating P-type ATPase [Castellaniella sp.]MDY0309331.1 cation-translocating P-type ATPase [Castellaniella sp.]
MPRTASAAVADPLDLESLRPAGRMIFSVRGMFCASCAMAVQRVIDKVPGVLDSHVNFTSGSALVRWDPVQFDFQALFDRVQGLGYEMSPLLDDSEVNRSLDKQAVRIRLQLIVAAFFGMWSMLGTWMLYLGLGAVAGIDAWLVGWAATIFSLPVVLYSGLDFYRAGWKTVRAGVPGMDALISLGVWGSLLLSLWNLSRYSPAVYVDAATMLVTFLLVGRLIEIRARKHNLAAIDALRQLMPETARLILPDGNQTIVALESVQPGSQVYVLAGERVPVDGVIDHGASQVDASLLTGESLPRPCTVGEHLHAGMVNLQAPLVLRVEQAQGQRYADRLGLRMLELFGAKSSMSRLAEQFARCLLPIVCVLSVLALMRHLWMGMAVDQALLASLSVLVAACPCAVGLALPLAFSTGSARASRLGILFRDPASVEALARGRTFAFDKTGTLTTGRLAVARAVSKRLAPGELVRIMASAESGVAHPVASAIVQYAGALGIEDLPLAPQVERHPAGVRYTAPDGALWLIGAAQWLEAQGVRCTESLGAAMDPVTGPASGATVHAARDGRWEGRIELQDTIGAESRAALDTLRQAGCRTLLVTGDHAAAAHWVGRQLGFEPQHIHAACKPDDKVGVLQQYGRGTVFIGDGINDTLVLAAADCGVAIPGANAIAVTASGVVITRGGLGQVVQARRMARQILRRIRQNLFFSICYNVVIVALFLQVGVTPGAAAVAMLLSSMTVLGNSVRPVGMSKQCQLS